MRERVERLSLVDLYGVISHSVSLRTQEIGIRVALGGQSSDILKLVFGQGLWMTLAGLTIGLVGAAAMTRTFKSLLFGGAPTDPMTIARIAFSILGFALLPSSLP